MILAISFLLFSGLGTRRKVISPPPPVVSHSVKKIRSPLLNML